MIEKRVKKLTLQESKNPAVDLYYWLSRTAEERIAFHGAPRYTGGHDLDEENFFSPVRVVIVTSIDVVEWGEAWNARTQGACGDEQVFFIGKQELVKNKRALGRRKDLADLEALGEL